MAAGAAQRPAWVARRGGPVSGARRPRVGGPCAVIRGLGFRLDSPVVAGNVVECLPAEVGDTQLPRPRDSDGLALECN